MLKPGTAKTFMQYYQEVFLPYVHQQMCFVQRVDIVWDDYTSNSLKICTRERRGKGSRKRVLPKTPIPTSWHSFLRNDDNKKELFAYLSTAVIQNPLPDKIIVTTRKQNLLSFSPINSSNLEPCNHEEADSRIFVHVLDAIKQGHSKIMIRTVDTDVVILAITAISFFAECYNNASLELWIAFGVGKSFRYIAAHHLAARLEQRGSVLPIFHALTGCDTVSFFQGKGKKTAWEVWCSFSPLTDALVQLSKCPKVISESSLKVIERFVVLLYDRTSSLNSVNDARLHLFTKKGRSLEGLPPTHEALLQHIRRTVFQGCYVWGNLGVAMQELPPPEQWGWKLEDKTFHPLWTTLPEAAKFCYELIHCKCKTTCRGRCKCVQASLQCTALCACNGECNRD